MIEWGAGDLDAILFDLDGTLVDTMPLHYQAYAEVLRGHGLNLRQEDYLKIVGPPAAEVIGQFIKAAGGEASAIDGKNLHLQKKAVFENLLATNRPQLLPAATLFEAAAGHIRCGLVSSGNRRGVEAILGALGWLGRFDVTVTGDDVINGKPDPEPYRRALESLGVDPRRCIALEDTPAGLDSARAAGIRAIDVTSPAFVA